MDHSEVRAAWDDVAAAYANARDPDGPDAALIDDLLAELPPAPTVLDVGCGDGARTLANLPSDAVGVDFSRAGLELATDTLSEALVTQRDMLASPTSTDSDVRTTAHHAALHGDGDHHAEAASEYAPELRCSRA